MNNQNNVERFYNKTTKQIMRFQPLFSNTNGNMVMGMSLDTDMETDFYDGYETHEIKRGQMVTCESPYTDDWGNRIKRSYKGKDLFIYHGTLKGYDIPNWINNGYWKNYDVIVGNN